MQQLPKFKRVQVQVVVVAAAIEALGTPAELRLGGPVTDLARSETGSAWVISTPLLYVTYTAYWALVLNFSTGGVIELCRKSESL